MSSANAVAMTVRRELAREAAQPAPRPAVDWALAAMAVGLALWFVCAAMVIATFVHPGSPALGARPAAEASALTARAPLARLLR